ncbi:N-acetylmuramoyl-L-alanine amidase [Calderihabitans maritimus]|uniref:N-acetylmuramoyl-L-alanine amidase n=1 Tax=Calderihabitans maritimus TaxID=1246530 RepID=A0A1Z5HR71_9FIRM|nr:N-acetylmuramoyl-L-alanine amidase [Calderihabitans maritimus]GAW91867.1 N-acetylmuramoyl-L-alanine amidase [Calderihabitans maritimus]
MAVKIGIDPGHGGKDLGTVGKQFGLQEKEVNLSVALELDRLLRNHAVETLLTRNTDVYVGLAERVKLLNEAKVDLVISLHVNSASNSEANYLSTHILARGGQAEKLAQQVQANLVKVTGWPDGGVRVNNFYILRETAAPAILVEMGFMSNPLQEQLLREDGIRKKLATGIAIGTLNYLGKDFQPPPEEEVPYSDVKGHWAEKDILYLTKLGILQGYPDGTFRPEQTVTRAELAVVIKRVIDYLQQS